jgi:hypothetical protein
VHDYLKPKKSVLSQINSKISVLKNRPDPGFKSPIKRSFSKSCEFKENSNLKMSFKLIRSEKNCKVQQTALQNFLRFSTKKTQSSKNIGYKNVNKTKHKQIMLV